MAPKRLTKLQEKTLKARQKALGKVSTGALTQSDSSTQFSSKLSEENRSLEKPSKSCASPLRTPPRKIPLTSQVPNGGKLDPVFAMAMAYETILGEYQLKPTLRWVNRHSQLDPRTRIYKAFQDAVKIANQVKAPYEEFVRAQFYWIHRIAGRAAKAFELRGTNGAFPAKERYLEYKKRIDNGEISGRVETIVIPSTPITDQELDKINKRRLEQLMDLWGMDEKQVYKTFANDGLFDWKWLIQQPVFQEMQRKN